MVLSGLPTLTPELLKRLLRSDADPLAVIQQAHTNMARRFDEAYLASGTPIRTVVLTEMKSWPVKMTIRSRSRRPPMQLVILVLIWLVLVVGPVGAERLPDELQALLSTEVGTVALALAITQMMRDKSK